VTDGTISKDQLMRFLKLEGELQFFQNGNTRVESELLMEFIRGTTEDREQSIERLESWLNRTWRTGRKPSEIPYSELIGDRK
jgi:hypothetical protein